MPIFTLNSEQFDTTISNNEIVFVDFWAKWCAPCNQFAGVYERIAEQNPTIKFTKVNIEEEIELSESFQIRSIPHLMIFKQGILIYSDAGAMPESTLRDLVEQALNIDVSEIKDKIDKGEV